MDLLFPIQCLGCTCRGRWLCPACWQGLAESEPQRCLGCNRDDPGGLTCPRCRSLWGALRGGWIVGQYAIPLLRQAISIFKYEEIRGLGEPLAGLLFALTRRPAIAETIARFRPLAIVVPVPMGARRQRRRGFNQAAELAGRFATLAALPVAEALRRDDREPQVTLDRTERLSNLAGAFSVADPLAVFGKTVILVDDVTTTGATALACATVLRASGARAVWLLALARG